MHDPYLGALVVLFSEGLLHSREGPWSLLVGGCVRVSDGAWTPGEIEEDGTWRLEMEGHFTYAPIYPEAVTLKEQIYKVFDAKT